MLTTQIFLSLGLNTLWISLLYGSPYGPLFATRIVQTLVLIILEFVVLTAADRSVTLLGRRMAV